jgi:glycosyltransferase involved in cell wall biosynthesis
MADLAPPVSVVMPARNAASTVGAAVEAVFAQEYAGDVELIVAVAPSTDATASAVNGAAAENPRMRVVSNPAATTPAGLNAAVAAASADIIVRCDAHCVLPPDYVTAAVSGLDSTGADVIGGIQDPQGNTIRERANAAAMRSRLGSGGATYRTGASAGPTDTVYLGVFRRSAVERVGGYDETLIRNQDYELNYRIRASGGIVWFDPALRVSYRPRGSFGGLWRQYFGYGRWKRRVLSMHPASTRLRQLIPPLFVLALAASAGMALARWFNAGLVVPLVYAAVVVATGIAAAARRRDVAALLSPISLAVMHIGWGLGFLVGPPEAQEASSS